jgi:hypothetical protein
MTRLGRALYRGNRMNLYERDLSKDIPEPETLMHVTWRIGVHADVDALNFIDFNYDETRKRLAHAALDEGAELTVAEYEGQIAHVCWTRFKTAVLPGVAVPLGAGRVFFYDDRTPEKFRGKRLHTSGIRVRARRAKAAGHGFAFALIDSTNTTSSHNFEREGFKHTGTMRTYRVLRAFRRTVLEPEVRARLSG